MTQLFHDHDFSAVQFTLENHVIVYDRHENVRKIPRGAIVEDMGTPTVFVVEDGKAVRRVVETGYGQDGFIEIVAGLEETDAIITVGQLGLKPDAEVSVIN